MTIRDRDQEMTRLMGRRMQSLRHTQGLHVSTLSDLTGISRSSIQNYEAGARQPSLAVLEKLANALGCSAAWLATFNSTDVNDENMHYHLVNKPQVGQNPATVDSVMFSKQRLRTYGCDFETLKVYVNPDNLMFPDLLRGDELLIEHKVTELVDTEIYAIRSNDGRVIFRYARRNVGRDGYTLYANNDAHFPPVVIEEENSNVEIIGRVIAVIRWK